MIYPDHYLPEDSSVSQSNRKIEKSASKKKDRSAQVEKQRTAPPSPHEVVMNKVRNLLQAGKAEEAFDLLNARGFNDPDSRNARAVCLLRMGQPELAVRALREICLTANGTMVKPDVPTHYATNLAAALFSAGNVTGSVAVLDELARDYAPSVAQMRGLVREWEGELSFWQRLKWKCGLDPGLATANYNVPIALDPSDDDSVLV